MARRSRDKTSCRALTQRMKSTPFHCYLLSKCGVVSRGVERLTLSLCMLISSRSHLSRGDRQVSQSTSRILLAISSTRPIHTVFRNLVSSIMGKAARSKRRGFSQPDTDSDAFKIGAGIDNDEITTSPAAVVTQSRSTRKLAVPNPRVEESAGRNEEENEAAVKAKGDETTSTPTPTTTPKPSHHRQCPPPAPYRC